MIFAIFILLAITFAFWKYSEIVNSVSHISGPKPLPFLGNSLMLIGYKTSELLELGLRIVSEYGLFCKILLGPIRLIIMSDPYDIEALLVDQKVLEKSEEYQITQVWIGSGILTASKDKWAPRRKITNVGFHFKNLQEFVKIFEKNSKILVGKLKKYDGKILNVFPLVQLCALDNICGEIKYLSKISFIYFFLKLYFKKRLWERKSMHNQTLILNTLKLLQSECQYTKGQF